MSISTFVYNQTHDLDEDNTHFFRHGHKSIVMAGGWLQRRCFAFGYGRTARHTLKLRLSRSKWISRLCRIGMKKGR